ncbi:hypothetical protein Pcinc_042540 [Petrolisthes cinctipes]|uniref:La-related protein 6 n=1 Tax=Petrolisthes cinctipes TaxID=88211 RepID=A0AAE1BHA6_PETCI|nr:hypothetical protein Pcinc_042540 [Petrolisthes cinctipes]
MVGGGGGGDTEQAPRGITTTGDILSFHDGHSPSTTSSITTDTDDDEGGTTTSPTAPKISIDLTEVGEDVLATQVGEVSLKEKLQKQQLEDDDDNNDCDLDVGAARRVRELVEYYLSDDHLVKDMFLLKHVTRHREGFVSIKLIASYKKVKRVSRGWRGVAVALKESNTLLLSPDATKVRRLAPLSALLHHDTRPFRMVLAAGVSTDKASMGTLAELFARFGDVMALQLHRPGGRYLPEVRQAERHHPELTSEICVLVEYDKVHQARHAVKYLLNNNTECGMRPIELPRPSPRSSSSHLDKPAISTEGESAYYSTSDFSEPPSPVCHPRTPLPRMRSPFSPYSSVVSSPSPSPITTRRPVRRPSPHNQHHHHKYQQQHHHNHHHQQQQQSSPESSPPSPYQHHKYQQQHHYNQQQQSSPESSPPSPYKPRRDNNNILSSPSSSTESRLDAPCCLHPPGSSPLPRRILARSRDSPSAPRRGSGSGSGFIGSSSGSLSPWLRRRNLSTRSAHSSPSASPLLRRRHDTTSMLPDNITRFPRGPDGSKGFIQRRTLVSPCA